MANDRVCMLFCPPMPPLRLQPGHPVSIGRHPSCDFPLQRDDISRRHAELRFEEGRWMVRDLGSTNGTWVGGQPVDGERSLQGGDRIELGSTTITFCEIESEAVGGGPAEDPGDAKTIIFARDASPRVPAAIHGDLAQVPGHAVMQLLEMGSQTGRLDVQTDEGSGRMWFQSGQPVHAESEKGRGLDVALALVAANRGSFRFDADAEAAAEQTIQASVTELLLESCRLADEGRC